MSVLMSQILQPKAENLLEGATVGPSLDSIGIETSGFETRLQGTSAIVIVARFDADMPSAGVVQKISITFTDKDRADETTQYSVKFPSVDGVSDKVEEALSKLENPETSKRSIELLDALAKGGHLFKEVFKVDPQGEPLPVSHENASRMPVAEKGNYGNVGTPAEFEKFLEKVGQGMRVHRSWVQSKYIELAQYEGQLPPDITQGFADIFRKWGMDSLADKLLRVNTIDPNGPFDFPGPRST